MASTGGSPEIRILSRKERILLSLLDPDWSRDQSSANQILSSENESSKSHENEKCSSENKIQSSSSQLQLHASAVADGQIRVEITSRAYLQQNVSSEEDTNDKDVILQKVATSSGDSSEALPTKTQVRKKIDHRRYLEQRVPGEETNFEDSVSNKTGSVVRDVSLNSRASVRSSESEGEKVFRKRGIDFTVVHKDAGVYTKIDAANLATAFHPRIMSNIRWIKNPLAAQSRKLKYKQNLLASLDHFI